MSVEQTDVVDIIGTEKSTGKVIMTVSDHLDWKDEQSHLLMLQEKLNRYLAFVESGEILSSYPDAKGRSIVFDVVMKNDLPDSARAFFTQVEKTLGSVGVELRYRTYRAN